MIDRYELLVAVAALLFSMGLLGVMIRRNLLVVVMSLELMLNAVVLSFVAAAEHTQTLHGAAMTLFVYVAATCEIAMAMASPDAPSTGVANHSFSKVKSSAGHATATAKRNRVEITRIRKRYRGAAADKGSGVPRAATGRRGNRARGDLTVMAPRQSPAP